MKRCSPSFSKKMSTPLTSLTKSGRCSPTRPGAGKIQSRLARLPEVLGPTGVMERAARAVMELVERPAEESAPQRLSAGSGS